MGWTGYPTPRLMTLAETGTRGVIGSATDRDEAAWPADATAHSDARSEGLIPLRKDPEKCYSTRSFPGGRDVSCGDHPA